LEEAGLAPRQLANPTPELIAALGSEAKFINGKIDLNSLSPEKIQ